MNTPREDESSRTTQAETDRPDPIEARGEVYTPLEIAHLYRAALQSRTGTRLITARGLFNPSGTREYNGWYYDTLDGPQDAGRVKLKVPTALHASLKPFQETTLRGVIEAQLRDDHRVEFVLVVTACLEQRAATANPDDLERLKLLREKHARGSVDVSALIRGVLARHRTPVIALVYGVTGIVDRDVLGALGGAVASYQVKEYRANLTSVTEIGLALERAKGEGCDLIAVVRGGGSGLETFDHPSLGRTLIDLEHPVVSAVGHAVDTSLFDQLADACFITPTAFGHFLKQLVDFSVQAESAASLRLGLEQEWREKLSRERGRGLRLTVALLIFAGLVVLGLFAGVLRMNWR